jgi:hypothetical protein
MDHQSGLIVRKATHADVWSVWVVREGSPSEEIFEAASEQEAANWIQINGPTWLEDNRRKRETY